MAGSSSSERVRRAGAALVVAVALLSAGCGKVNTSPGDAGSTPPPAGDGGSTATEGAPGRDLLSGSGRMTGAGMTLDVQIGLPIEQRPSQGTGGVTFEGGAAIKP